ncbi:His_kinase domain-containing protein [Tenacibaculum sp. 190524A02b]|uniref:His_kinase domain-containing protein n=2 Tax=Tenacibaculum vairaonense TaxID=3137860 RepID=A0ABM9PSI8_9FLAO
MADFIKKHSAQIVIHFLFWGLFTLISLFVFTPYYWTENPFLQYFFILVCIVYSNNLWLLPFFVKKKWYFLYISLFIVISFSATQLYCYAFTRCGCTVLKCLSDYLWQTIVPLLFFSFIWMLFRYIEKTKEMEKIKQESIEMELKFLKSQINPHVLFNNLNTIYSYSIEVPEKTPDLILKLSDNLKHVLYESNAQKVKVEKELNFIDNYIEFHRLRTEGVKVINYQKNTVNAQGTIAPLLLITLIENAFKHSKVHSIININIEVEGKELTFKCENEFDKKSGSLEETRTIGLKNLRKRLELIYEDHYELIIKEEKSRFSVLLSLNLV